MDEDKFDAIWRREHGNLFHIVMLALKHLSYEQGNGLQVVDIEHVIKPQIFNTKTGGGSTARYSHVVDIMLSETYEITEGQNGIAVELKSYQARSLSAGTARWKRGTFWRINKAGKRVKVKQPNSHKQFYLDRVALYKNDIADFEWWYQSFNKISQKHGHKKTGPTAAQINSIARPRLTELPLPLGGAKYTLGASTALRPIMKRKIDLANAKGLVIKESETFLKGMATDTVNELVTDLYE